MGPFFCARWPILRVTMRSFSILFLMAFTGCQWMPHRSVSSAPSSSPIASSQAAADGAALAASAARDREEAAAREVVSRVLVNVQTAKAQNDTQPPGTATTVVAGELGIAESRLSNVVPSADERVAAAQRQALVASGKADEARSAYASATSAARALADELAKAKAATASAEATAAAAKQHEREAVASYQATIAADAAATAKQIADLKAAHKEELARQNEAVLHDQVRWLNWAAAGCLAIFLLGIGFGQIAGAKIVWPFGLIAAMLLGLAQIISQWWFVWAAGSALAVAAVAVGWWVWSHYRAGTLAADSKKKAEQLGDVTKALVPVLDKAYSSASDPLKALLDEKVFGPLNSLMDSATKATVHAIRAEQETPSK